MIRGSSTSSRHSGFFSGVDIIGLLLYGALTFMGCLCITSATFEFGSLDYLSTSHLYVRQFIWVVIGFVAAIVVLLADTSIFHKYAYLFYFAGVGLLILALLFGREVNGAKSWFDIGGMRIQPVEMVKISTSLALARVMSDFRFEINKLDSLARIIGVVALPLLVIVMQNDTGSGIVFGSFLFVLYREDLDKWLCIPVILFALLFILSFLLSPEVLLFTSFTISILCNAMMYGRWKLHIIYTATILLVSIVLQILASLLFGVNLSYYVSMMIVSLVSLPVIVFYSYRHLLARTYFLVGFYLFSMIFLPVSNYIFNYILRPHQQNRIMSFLGIVNDPLGLDYNVNQSKIAIGSGGLFGKGWLNGTQIKYGFVPERHTDFIFCDLAEEWGFVGAFLVLALMMSLILRLIYMGERQVEAFGRIYCYCVASILLFHTFVNVGMTIGLMPVMGIPLPFMSYGGSSFVAFTIMVFVAFRLDASVSRLDCY